MNKDDPRNYGFYMPGEWTEHACCWMAWPCRSGMWGDSQATQKAYAEVANTIARFEPLKMLVPPHKLDSARALLDAGIEVIELGIDDSWTRDSGPNFLVNDSGEIAGSTWVFNAWGNKYQPFDQDALMGTRILELADVRSFASALVAEGGGVTVDGEGTVITTETCLLNKNRNPGWSKKPGRSGTLPHARRRERSSGCQAIRTTMKPMGTSMELQHSSNPVECCSRSIPTKPIRIVTSAKSISRYSRIRRMPADVDCRSSSFTRASTTMVCGTAAAVPISIRTSPTVRLWCPATATTAMQRPSKRTGISTLKGKIVQVQIHDIATGGGGVHCITQQQPAPLR